MFRVGYHQTIKIGRLRDFRPALQFLSAGLVAVAKVSHRVGAQWNAKWRLRELRDLQDRGGTFARIARLPACGLFQVRLHHSHRLGVSFEGVRHGPLMPRPNPSENRSAPRWSL